ncbi:MAG: DOPA 4,5-dioxygenase family protein [Hyphomicrobiaceae bacterium]|nr:DOPA 4,5-dioxygenase family protein [Hyphomicrobiaceae bacterium]
MTRISGYHAHVYFDANTLAQARTLCEEARDRFGVEMGRVHEKPVGPHPDWSCQLAFGPEKFADVVPWLALNRNGLTVFIHPETGEELNDHTEHAMWMGRIRPLDTSIFEG